MSVTLDELNRYKFNRRLRVATLVLGYLLIFVMIGAGYMQYKQKQEIGKNYCYACGLFEGKQCTTKYFTSQEINAYGQDKLLQDLADSNGKKDAIVKDEFTDRMLEDNITIDSVLKRYDNS